MKRKMMIVLMTTVLAFSMAACSGGETKKNGSDKTVQTEEKKNDDKSGEEDGGDTPEEEKETKVDKIQLENSDGTLVYQRHELTTDYSGASAVRIYFMYTNLADESKTAQLTFHPQVFQNGVECQFTTRNFSEENEACDNLSKELMKGTSLEVAFMYTLQDTGNPLVLKVTDMSPEHFLDGLYQEQELALQ